MSLVNEILGDHNVDKEMTDSRGDVCASMIPCIQGKVDGTL